MPVEVTPRRFPMEEEYGVTVAWAFIKIMNS